MFDVNLLSNTVHRIFLVSQMNIQNDIICLIEININLGKEYNCFDDSAIWVVKNISIECSQRYDAKDSIELQQGWLESS